DIRRFRVTSGTSTSVSATRVRRLWRSMPSASPDIGAPMPYHRTEAPSFIDATSLCGIFPRALVALAIAALSCGLLRAQDSLTPVANSQATPTLIVSKPQTTPAVSDGVRHITLAEAQQQAAGPSNALVRIGRLNAEAAKEHRLGVQSDYFPKIGASFLN